MELVNLNNKLAEIDDSGEAGRIDKTNKELIRAIRAKLGAIKQRVDKIEKKQSDLGLEMRPFEEMDRNIDHILNGNTLSWTQWADLNSHFPWLAQFYELTGDRNAYESVTLNKREKQLLNLIKERQITITDTSAQQAWNILRGGKIDPFEYGNLTKTDPWLTRFYDFDVEAQMFETAQDLNKTEKDLLKLVTTLCEKCSSKS